LLSEVLPLTISGGLILWEIKKNGDRCDRQTGRKEYEKLNRIQQSTPTLGKEYSFQKPKLP